MAETTSAPSLRELSEAATAGPWFAEAEKSDGSYGSSEDTSEGYDTAVIMTEAETRYGKPGVLFESHNSTVGMIHEESDDEWFRAWDAVSEANATFIVALVNAFRAGRLIDPTTLSEAVASARAEGWQPIETAPKDETEVDLWMVDHLADLQWRQPGAWWDEGRWVVLDDSGDVREVELEGIQVATHWQPLPAPPTTPGGRTDG